MSKLELSYQVDLSELKEKVEKLLEQSKTLIENCNILLITIEELQKVKVEFKQVKE